MRHIFNAYKYLGGGMTKARELGISTLSQLWSRWHLSWSQNKTNMTLKYLANSQFECAIFKSWTCFWRKWESHRFEKTVTCSTTNRYALHIHFCRQWFPIMWCTSILATFNYRYNFTTTPMRIGCKTRKFQRTVSICATYISQ